MLPPDEFPEELAHLDELIRDLRDAVEKNASASAIGLAAARIHLKYISRIRAFWDRLDVIIGFEVLADPLPHDEFIPRLNTNLRMMGELHKMLLGQISGLLDCFGGTATIGIQQLVKWSDGDPVRQQIILNCRAAANRTRRSRR